MTERKPPDEPIHRWVDRLIRDAEERGAFDNLPGAGKPLAGLDKPLDDDWWIRQKLRSEDLPADGLLPPALRLRKELADLPEAVRHLRDEDAVRAAVREVNTRVAAWIRTPSGPVLPVVPADVESVVAGWRAERESPAGAPAVEASAPPPARERRRWRRRWRRAHGE